VGQEGVLPGGEADGLEADAGAALAKLLRLKTGEAEPGQSFDEAADGGRLAACRRAGEQEVLDVRASHATSPSRFLWPTPG
jgi:hypothetical protein